MCNSIQQPRWSSWPRTIPWRQNTVTKVRDFQLFNLQHVHILIVLQGVQAPFLFSFFLWFLFCFKYKFVCYVSLHFSSLKIVLFFFVTLFICFEDQKEGLKCPPLTGLLKGYLVKFKLPSNRNELSVEQIINKLIIFFSPPEICQFESWH